MGELVVRRWSIHQHLTWIANCIAALVIASSISSLDSIRRLQRA
jgi:hypothetical protein